MLVGLLGKLVMHTLTRFAFTLTQLLVWGYMFGACVAANAQAQKPLYTRDLAWRLGKIFIPLRAYDPHRQLTPS
jgi:hypothetical protein